MMYQMSLLNIEKVSGGKLIFAKNRLSPQSLSPENRQEKGNGLEIDGQTIVLSVVLDSRRVEPGALFLAAKGERVDGHQFIASAFEKGAYCVVTEKTPTEVEKEYGIPSESWGAYILVEDTFRALREIGEFYRSNLKLPVIGITGSVGKTSTKEFIAGVLGVKYKVLKTEGNYNNEIGLPLTLLQIREEHDVAVVEMGISDFGEMGRLSKMARPDICVFTNIGQSHLETLKTRDGILKAKTEMFEYMSPVGDVCLNGDDDKLRSIRSVNGKEPHFFGIGTNPPKEVYGTDIISRGLDGSDVLLHLKEKGNMEGEHSKESFGVHVPLPGEHMVVNAAAAACVARLLGLTPEQIGSGIAGVKPVRGRSNLIRLPRYTLIDDCYNANPVSMKAAIDLLGTAETLKIAILGDMFDLGENSDILHDDIGAYAAAAGLDVIICIGENARNIYVEAKRAAIPEQTVVHYAAKQEFLRDLRENRIELPDCGTILIKASHGMAFEEIVNFIMRGE